MNLCWFAIALIAAPVAAESLDLSALGVAIEHALRSFVISAPAPVGAEGHRAQAQRRDAQAAAAKQAVVIQREQATRQYGMTGPLS